MVLEKLEYDFSICKLKSFSGDELCAEFSFAAKTDQECSLVCITEQVPNDTLAREDGWKAFRISGMLDFSLTGILAGIARQLAEHKISIFAVSTFNTDYVLVKEADFEKALSILGASGWKVR